jgi:hypothetical protein
VNVLNELGGKYSYPLTWDQGEFEVPYDEAHKAVFTGLQNANVSKISKKQQAAQGDPYRKASLAAVSKARRRPRSDSLQRHAPGARY